MAARQIPSPWVAQVRPGGVVVLPWGSSWYPSALLRLTVRDDGSASGRIIGGAGFMVLRAQRQRRWGAGEVFAARENVVRSQTDLHPWYVSQPDAGTAIGLRLPGCAQYHRDDGDLGPRLNVVDRGSGSWARVHITDDAPYPVEQSGPRALWDEAVDAYRRWQASGEPAAGDWLVTVDRDGQRVELG